jgi:hypothetical protein
MEYRCECGSKLTNHYVYQIDKHRRSKRHLLNLIERHKEWDEEAQTINKTIIKPKEQPNFELTFN